MVCLAWVATAAAPTPEDRTGRAFVLVLAGVVLFALCALAVRAVTLGELRYLVSLARRRPPDALST